MATSYRGEVRAPDFPKGLDWINSDHPISIKELRGHIVILHVRAVCFVDGHVYLADTYNNRIKVLNPRTREVKSFAGTGEAGFKDSTPDSAQFNEPAGLAAASGKLYVADTNNNAIRIIDITDGTVKTLNVQI